MKVLIDHDDPRADLDSWTRPTLAVPPPGRPDRGSRQKCAHCPKRAAIRRMVRGPDGRLYGSKCAQKLGYLARTPRPPVLAAPPHPTPPVRSTAQTPSLFDVLEESPVPTTDHHTVLLGRTREQTRPDVSALLPDNQHFVVLNALEADLIKPVAEKEGLLGRHRILTRHAPHISAFGSPSCQHCFQHAATGRDHLIGWPCIDYADAAAGLVTGLGHPS